MIDTKEIDKVIISYKSIRDLKYNNRICYIHTLEYVNYTTSDSFF